MKKNISKKVKIIVAVVLLIIACLFVYQLTRSDIKKKVFSCKNVYAPMWKYDYAYENEEKKSLYLLTWKEMGGSKKIKQYSRNI